MTFKKLILNPRTGPWLRGLDTWRCMRKMIRKAASRTIQGIMYLSACLLWEYSEGKRTGIFLARLQVLISPSHFQGINHRHLYFWILKIIIQMSRLEVKRKCHLFKFHLLFISYFFLVWIYPPNFIIASQSTSPRVKSLFSESPKK
jgi:hypothetical protein